MKFALKNLVAAATLATTAAAQAAIVSAGIGQAVYIDGVYQHTPPTPIALISGSGSLAFSTGADYVPGDVNTMGGLIGALNVGLVKINGIGGATVTEVRTPDPYGEIGDTIRVSSVATASVVGMTINDQTGQLLSVQSSGGAQQVGTRISGTLTGGTASVTNLRFDLVNKVVYADLLGTKAAVGTRPAVTYDLPNTALWRIDAISGPTVIPPLALVAEEDLVRRLEAAGFTHLGNDRFSAVNVISGLRVTQEGFNFFRDSLGLLSTGVGALSAVNTDPQGWGTVTSTLVFAVPVPEPTAYALMGAGLLVVGFAARAQRRAR